MQISGMNLEKILEFSPNMWEKIQTQAISIIKRRTQSGYGVDNDGRKYRFRPYSKEYAEAKSRGMTRLTNRRGPIGSKYKHLSGVSTDRQVVPPNFRLRGQTMRDLKPRGRGATWAAIGWQGEYGFIVDAHEEKGKYIIDNFEDKEIDEIIDTILEEIDKNIEIKVKDVNIEIKI